MTNHLARAYCGVKIRQIQSEYDTLIIGKSRIIGDIVVFCGKLQDVTIQKTL